MITYTLRKNRGVTLVELLTVMVIVGILAAIAVPSYRAYAVRTHRAAARACLSEAAQFMERYYTSNLTYVGATITLGCQTEGGLTRFYDIAVKDSAQRTYTLVADPKASQLKYDGTCATLTLDETGKRGAGDNSAPTIASCW